MWRGMPYAAAERLRAPSAPEPWLGVRDAAEFGPVAPQDHRGQFLGAHPDLPSGEDCQSINVIAPSGGAVGLPVMVFIHGGAYSVGSSREMPHQGETLVREGGVVFVNFNYRLGALGYLDFTSVADAEHPFASNLGLRDQLAALEWVRDNIGGFGGDPQNVTIFGESAGANAVTTLMTVPAAAGLFARAIAQSSPPNAIYPPELTARWAAEYLELLASIVDAERPAGTSLTDPSIDEPARMLLEASTSQLVRATTLLQRSTPDAHPGTICLCPVIDGDLLPERPLDAFKAGHAHAVPLIIGTNDREGSLFRGRLDILATTPQRIHAIFAKTRKRSRRALKAQYPGLPASRPAADFAGDYAFWYPSVKVAERHAEFAPVWFYRFDVAPRLVRMLGLDATHGLELFALFDRLDAPFGRAMTALGGRREFRDAGRRLRAAWVRFATDGSVASAWAPYDRVHRRTLVIDARDRLESDPRAERRRAWQEFVPHV